MLRLVQIARGNQRRVAIVEEPNLCVLRDVDSVYALAQLADTSGTTLDVLVEEHASSERIAYEPIYRGESEWRLLTPIDHPIEPSRCLVSGTGLTHMGSASNRNAMHGVKEADLTDSMKIFRWGVEGGRPPAGEIGTPPEWFYKGTGTILRAHGEGLLLPAYGEDGGEEGELVGVYIVAANGKPRRVGMCIGNEFSDHKIEKKNYLYLAGSKMRTCSIGPELVIDPEFASVPGTVSIERDGETIWSKDVCTGEEEMCHSLQNIEHHHFKYEPHRRPGDVHVHFFGAIALSFADGVRLQHRDIMHIGFEGFGRALRNPLEVDTAHQTLVVAAPLT